jgi:hypothetical protein
MPLTGYNGRLSAEKVSGHPRIRRLVLDWVSWTDLLLASKRSRPAVFRGSRR